MFILWLLGLLLSPLIRRFMGPKGGPRPHGAAGEVPESKAVANISNYTRAARDGFLILLGMTLINMAGHGITAAVVTLTWIIFGLLVLWLLFELAGMGYWWLDMVVLLPIVVLSIINFAFSFR
ncbi:hypothetical protein HK102_010733 [Quaeritorhiza haematococci]|nr:hypothetical protein HK102_010733 [Quaeritorhiza haematococci]